MSYVDNELDVRRHTFDREKPLKRVRTRTEERQRKLDEMVEQHRPTHFTPEELDELASQQFAGFLDMDTDIRR